MPEEPPPIPGTNEGIGFWWLRSRLEQLLLKAKEGRWHGLSHAIDDPSYSMAVKMRIPETLYYTLKP